MKKWNKATVAVIGGGVATAIGAAMGLEAEMIGAIQTVLVAALVALVPNVGS